MNATVEIVIVEQPDVLTIPVMALQSTPAGRDAPPSNSPSPSVLVKDGDEYVPREISTGRTDHRVIEVLEGLREGEVLGIPMVSRLKQENDRLDERVRSTRSFGSAGRGEKKPADRRS
jgi:hypothetical protein